MEKFDNVMVIFSVCKISYLQTGYKFIFLKVKHQMRCWTDGESLSPVARVPFPMACSSVCAGKEETRKYFVHD